MCLRFVFLLITRTASWLRLSQREETWKIAEILLLRHQLSVLQRRQPRRPDLDWADRALHATLLAVIPKVRHYGLRLLVSPDTIVRWHRDIVRCRWAARSIRGKTGRPATRRNIKAPSSRWHDQRISPGRMTWTRFSAPDEDECHSPSA
jgi:putative transposase